MVWVTGQLIKTGHMTDYGVVPVLGCTVRVSVAEVVTNAWLVSLSFKQLINNYDVVDYVTEIYF